MKSMLKHRLWAVVAFSLFLLLGGVSACSDDTSAGEGGQRCATGERFNEIHGRCEPVSRDDGRGPQNPGPGSGGAPDAGGLADSGLGGQADSGGGEPGGGEPGGTNPDAGLEPGGNNPPGPGPGPGTEPADECGFGSIVGKACAPSGEILGGATVHIRGVDCEGQAFEMSVQTDRHGEYQFDNVPAGVHDLTISIGSFSGDHLVRVTDGQTTDLTLAVEKICLDASNVRIAVIQGAYDRVEQLLGNLGLTYDIKGHDDGGALLFPNPREAREFLSDLRAMQQYDIIFINCGLLWNNLGSGARPAIVNNLRAYVNGGGSLYASDWAHHFVESTFPEMVDFYGNDANTSEALNGFAPQTIPASVVSTDLEARLGRTQTSIEFPHNPARNILNNNWAVAEGAGSGALVHLQGDVKLCANRSSCNSAGATVPNAPLLVSYVTPGGGTVFFTSFHNESQDGISHDMEEILKFLIFQL